MKRHLRNSAIFGIFALVISCGGGGATVSLDEASSSATTNHMGGSEFSTVGSVTIVSSTDSYDLALTLGDAAPIGIVVSDAGTYEIQAVDGF